MTVGKREVTIAVLFAFAAAGCSSSGNKPGTPASSASTSTPATTACTPARTAPAPSTDYSFGYGGTARAYLLALPGAYDGRTRYPMVFDFAGDAGTKESQEATTLMGARGTARGYIVVTPDALGSPRQWNQFGLRGRPDDFGFVHALAADLEQRLCIDSGRVYAVGHSNGAAFAGFLVCRAPYIFAAVAMVSATTPAECPTNIAPAVLAIAGTADTAVPYAGGTVANSVIPIPAAPTTISYYAKRFFCTPPQPRTTEPAPGVAEIEFSGCTDGSEVVLDTITDGTHAWPGGPAAAADAKDSAAGRSFPATERILDFFARHHLPSSP